MHIRNSSDDVDYDKQNQSSMCAFFCILRTKLYWKNKKKCANASGVHSSENYCHRKWSIVMHKCVHQHIERATKKLTKKNFNFLFPNSFEFWWTCLPLFWGPFLGCFLSSSSSIEFPNQVNGIWIGKVFKSHIHSEPFKCLEFQNRFNK